MAINPQALLPIVRSSMPHGTDQQILEALKKFGDANPKYGNMEVLALLKQYMQEKQSPSIGMMARKGKIK
jgi:hypothetical protein